MATVVVAFDGSRLTNADASSSFTNEGAAPTSETDYYYQGTASVSIQVKTGEVGTYYTHGTTDNFSANNLVWIAKIIQTNKDAIDGAGLQLKIGSANTASYLYGIFDSNTYPTTGGWQIVCINPNITQWRTSTIGTPDLTAVDTYGIRSDAAFTAKAPNLGIDCIDWIPSGRGLTLTRGDAADANGSFTNFVTFDEGTQANRYGIVQTRGGIIYVNGTLSIGNSSVNTEFTDSNKVLVFPDHRVSNGFAGLAFNLANSGSGVSMSSMIFNGRGALSTNDDTRPDYTVTGNVAALSIEGSTFNVFRQMNLTSSCTISGTALLSGQRIYQNSANIYGCTITGAATANGSAFIVCDNPAKIKLNEFTFSANGGHALELTTAGSYAFDENVFTGYGIAGSGNAAIYNNSGGLVTLNLSGTSIPTVRNGSGATTNVVASAVLTLTGLATNSEIVIYDYQSESYDHAGGLLTSNNGVTGYVQSATVVNGGTGYTVADTLTVSGGTGTAATLTVDSVSGGVITAVSVASNGEYTVNPSQPAAVTGGTGSSATFNLDISGEFSYSYSASGQQVNIVIHHLDYKTERFQQYSLPASNSSIIVRQIGDRVFFNP